MVDRIDLPKINGLYAERSSIAVALSYIDEGGRIVGMTIGKMSEDNSKFVQFQASVSTVGWEYPPQMTATIKEYLHAREEAITRELIELGVTGLDEPPPQHAPQRAAPQHAAPKRRKA